MHIFYKVQWDDDDPNLFESDVPITTRFLVDQYTDSDDASEGCRTFFFDIEVEVVDGFPDVMKANEKITSIAFYDEMVKKYFCYTLDEKKTIQNYEKDDEIVEFLQVRTTNKVLSEVQEISPDILSVELIFRYSLSIYS